MIDYEALAARPAIQNNAQDRPGLYAVRCIDSGLVKFGQSVKVWSRIMGMQYMSERDTGYPLRIEYVGAYYYHEPKWLERWVFRQLHIDQRRVFHPHAMGIEWTDLAWDEAVDVVRFARDLAQWRADNPPYTTTEMVTRNSYDGPVAMLVEKTPLPELVPGRFARKAT